MGGVSVDFETMTQKELSDYCKNKCGGYYSDCCQSCKCADYVEMEGA